MFKSVSRISNKVLNIKPKYVHYNSFAINIKLINDKSILISNEPNLLPNEPELIIDKNISFDNIINSIVIIGASIYMLCIIQPKKLYRCNQCYKMIHRDCKCSCHSHNYIIKN